MSSNNINKILIKRSDVSNNIPNISSLSLGELGLNTHDGKLFIKTETPSLTSIKTFLNSDDSSYLYNESLSGAIAKDGGNTISEVFANVLGGYSNDVSGAASTTVNGEDNDIESDFSLIGSGLNNKIKIGADNSFVAAGQNNLIAHSNVFTLGSNLSSHANNFTYVNNISAQGIFYGDGSGLRNLAAAAAPDLAVRSLTANWESTYTTVLTESASWIGGGGGGSDVSILSAKWENSSTVVQSNSANWNIIGDRYVTTSTSTNTINKGTKIFIVDTDLSYISTQDVTIVHAHDINNHMHGTVLDYNSINGSLTADIGSNTGSGTYSNWIINIGGTPNFVDSLIPSNNLSDVTDFSIALTNLNGISKTEIAGLSGTWQNTFTTVQSNSANWGYSQLQAVDPLKFVFTGNGSTVNYTVSGTSNSTNASVVEVFVNNVRQEPSVSYTLASDIITFAVAPAASSRIVVITPNKTIVATPNTVTYSQLNVAKRHEFIDYNTYSVSYAGLAPYGSLENAAVWRITKITYTYYGSVSATGRIENSAWTARSSLTYTY